MAGQRVEELSSLPCPLSPAADCLYLPQGLGPTHRPSLFSTAFPRVVSSQEEEKTQLPGPQGSKN